MHTFRGIVHLEPLSPFRQWARIVAAFAAALALASVQISPAGAAESPRGAAVREWHTCNDLWGSPLCISVRGSLNDKADIKVWYSKNSGPRRFVRLYLRRCGKPGRDLVVQGYVKPHETIDGGKVRHIFFKSCWVGDMRLGNRNFTTGELLTR